MRRRCGTPDRSGDVSAEFGLSREYSIRLSRSLAAYAFRERALSESRNLWLVIFARAIVGSEPTSVFADDDGNDDEDVDLDADARPEITKPTTGQEIFDAASIEEIVSNA